MASAIYVPLTLELELEYTGSLGLHKEFALKYQFFQTIIQGSYTDFAKFGLL